MGLSRHRRDPILDTVAQTLAVVSRQGGHLSVALTSLQDTVRERVRIRLCSSTCLLFIRATIQQEDAQL